MKIYQEDLAMKCLKFDWTGRVMNLRLSFASNFILSFIVRAAIFTGTIDYFQQ